MLAITATRLTVWSFVMLLCVQGFWSLEETVDRAAVRKNTDDAMSILLPEPTSPPTMDDRGVGRAVLQVYGATSYLPLSQPGYVPEPPIRSAPQVDVEQPDRTVGGTYSSAAQPSGPYCAKALILWVTIAAWVVNLLS